MIAVLSAAFIAVGCSSSSDPVGSTASASAPTARVPSQAATLTLTPTASPVSATEATALPTSTGAVSPTPGDVLSQTTVVTVVEGVRERSKPEVSDASFKYEPLLPRGTPLYVLDGPISASGYT